MIEALKTPVSIFLLGIIIGSYFTKRYLERSQNHSLGKAIESIMISRNIEEIHELSKAFNTIVEKLSLSGDELVEKVINAQDIEKPLNLSSYEINDVSNIEINENTVIT
jgi:hypothetical protein